MKNNLKISVLISFFILTALVFIIFSLLIADYNKDKNKFLGIMAIIFLIGIIGGLFINLLFKKFNYFLFLILFSTFLFSIFSFIPSNLNKFLMFNNRKIDKSPITYKNQIEIYSPRSNEKIKSPLKISGRARGNWFFEANFPVILTNWDGMIIAESYVQANGDWMTENFVDFKAILEFQSPVFSNVSQDHFSRKGYLIFKKANPTGLAQYDDALEIPIEF